MEGTAIILAGGLGTRLKPLTDKTPKPLLPVNGKPILVHAIENLKKYGITKIILSICFHADKIKDYFGDGSKFGVDISYSIEDEPLGTGGGIRFAAQGLTERFIVLNGDNLADFDFDSMIKCHERNRAKITIALYPVEDVTRFGIADMEGERIVRFIEKPTVTEAPSNLNNAGAYIMEPDALSVLPKGKCSIERDCFEKLASQGVIFGYVHEGQWFPTDDIVRYSYACNMWKGIIMKDRKDRVDELEKELVSLVKNNTPKDIQMSPAFDIGIKEKFEFILTKELVDKLELWAWFNNYKKEALVSTGGIRGPQNILYPWDVRFPINQVGVMLATLGKAHVLNDKYKSGIQKIAASEVRYNSKTYVDIITRIQAAEGITTHVPCDRSTIPIWMASFLVFKLDFAGGEYVTSSHAVSTKIATKDLNDQGSQFMPEESLMFVDKIEDILKKAESEGYKIIFESSNHPLISDDLMTDLNNGVDLYVDYLRKGVATDFNLRLIQNLRRSIIIDNVGGCTYKTQVKIFKKLGIQKSFRWFNVEEDPFFHGIGKIHTNPKTGADEYFDLSCDASILAVVKTMGYEDRLGNQPFGATIEIVDPDGDRLIIGQVEPRDRVGKLQELGIDFIDINEDKVLTIYTPNQSYLMIMDFHMKQLKESGLWYDHPRFIIKTTASAMSWDEWGLANDIQVINLPVGFKEIASMMKKVEKQIIENPNQEVIVHDIYGDKINLGEQPRLFFAGEESGGMVTGPEHLIESKKGRKAIAMREKSDGEAIIITSALIAILEKEKKFLSTKLEEIFRENKIFWKYDIRVDNILYNESNPDPISLKKEKEKGEEIRDQNDRFFLGIAMARRENLITVSQAREIFSEAFPALNFDGFEEVFFVGDGTYMKFKDKYVEIRKSGTDAKSKAYAAGDNKQNCTEFAQEFAFYDGKITSLHKKYIGDEFLKTVEKKSKDIYFDFLRTDL